MTHTPIQKRERAFVGFSTAALSGAVLLFGLITWLLWVESIETEEERVAGLARDLGQNTEEIIVDARNMLEAFNKLGVGRCSDAHLSIMHEAAIAKPYIRAIGYWRAAQRLCGVGFIQAVELKPSRADRIYDSGVIAWWPSSQTAVSGVPLFLMRYGDHDIAIDPRMLLEPKLVQDRQAGLWVEGLPMATTAGDSDIPSPDSVPIGLTVDTENNRLVSRFALGTIFPIDIVAVDTIDRFWSRYGPILMTAAGLGLMLAIIWIYLVLRYSRHRLSLSTELREAVRGGRVLAYYQPVIELSSGRCVGAEALARWIREDGEMVRPDIFIPLAEQAGLVPEITLAIVTATLQDLGKLLKEHPELCININLAPEDLTSVSFSSALSRSLDTTGVAPASIKLEITERAMVDTEASRQIIRNFRMRGHQIAVDDFGTGYSSLAYLQALELDTLKIDKSFVDAIGTEAVTNHVIGHVIEMAKSLELDMVAEGIETTKQANWLIEQGVEYGQGFFYSRPLPASDFQYFFHKSDEAVSRKRLALVAPHASSRAKPAKGRAK
jgi:sensor c-di-GMP phosphodiesterase-like protein